jgi:arylsulfatase
MKFTVAALLAASLASLGGELATAQPLEKPFTWPLPPKAPAGAPNILLILTDDVGFGAASTFGGPIQTPTFDALANHGLRYNNFHTTGVCSPTRAALLTGRNHHDVGMARVTDAPAPADAYTTMVPKSAATVAEILRQSGYSTAMFGKSHLVPLWEQSMAGPFDRWPTGMGFDYFYGFLNGDTDQYAPQLYLGTTPVEPPGRDPNYILDRDLADKARQWIADQEAAAPGKPFMIYYATGTAHSPFHAPADWIARYKGNFDKGWDVQRQETFARQKQLGLIPSETKLTPRPSMLPAWNTLSPERRRVYAHMMEVYAASLSYADAQIGRVLDMLERTGQLDNTLVIYIQGDNGSSAEGAFQGLWNEMAFINAVGEDFSMVKDRIDTFGGPKAYNHFPAAWANAMSTPFPYFKRVASHLGATTNGMVMSWPTGIHKNGEVRSQFHHVIDVAPTILEAAHVAAPSIVNGVPQKRIDGVSMTYTFGNAKAPGVRRTQYFEIEGSRAIYHDGWLASTTPDVMPWELFDLPPYDATKQKWELYNLAIDFSQSTNVAEKNPKKLSELKNIFEVEARDNQVYPLKRVWGGPPPDVVDTRTVYSYVTPVSRIPAMNAPNLLNRSFEIEASVEVPVRGASGMLVTQGGRFGGYGLYMQDSTPVFVYNRLGLDGVQMRSPERLSPGRHDVKLQFEYDGGGVGRGGVAKLIVDHRLVMENKVAATIPYRVSLSETFDVGLDTGTPVSDDYVVPFAFTGELIDLTVRLK